MGPVTTWTVDIGRYSGSTFSPTNFASRTLGISIVQHADPGMLGTGTANLTLDNSDGELTPGGTGTYASVDWLSSGILLDVTVDGVKAQVFHGVITDFVLNDDGGGRSTVQIMALDAFQVIGRQQAFQYSMTNTSTADQLFDMTSPHLTTNATKVPTLGLSTMRTFWEPLNPASSSVGHDLPSSAGEVVLGDVINNSVMPNEQTLAFPTILDTDNQYVADDSWVGFTVDGLVRDGTYATGNVFEFSDFDTLPVGQLPFRQLVRDFHLDLITNAATVTALDGGTAQSHTDEDSQERYGTRARSYQTTSTSNSRALYTAQLWVNRYAYTETFDMTASGFQVTDGMIRTTGAQLSKWRALLDVTTGWWNTGSIRYDPTGGTARTDNFVIAGRTIEATPQDTSVTLKVRPQEIYIAFILNDSQRGVLDQNRLG